MDRRRFLLTSLAGALAAPRVAAAQSKAKVFRIGYLGTSSPALDRHLLDAFLGALRDLGYAEGQNLTMCTVGRKGGMIGFPSSPLSSCV